VTINGGEKVTWTNNDPTPSTPHRIFIDNGDVSGPIDNGESFSLTFPDPGNSDETVTYHVDSATGAAGTVVVKGSPPPTTTTPTTQATTTTKPATTTTSSGSTTTSTSSTTTTSSSTTTTSTTVFSSFSGPISVTDKGGSGGGSSALPLLLGALLLVAALAGLAYWLWLRSGEPYDEDDGMDWTQEPPPTVQGPRL
jgi:hypothetical protein